MGELDWIFRYIEEYINRIIGVGRKLNKGNKYQLTCEINWMLDLQQQDIIIGFEIKLVT